MAKRKDVIERMPDMLREPEKYFDAKFTYEERELLKEKICAVAGLAGLDSAFDVFYYRLEVPTQRELCRALDRIGWGRHDDLPDYVLIKLSRDLGIDYHNFAKNVPKLSIAGFVQLALRTFIDFGIAKNSTVKRLQDKRLGDLWHDWRISECPRRGCHKAEHGYCSDRFQEPDFERIANDIAKQNSKRRRIVGNDIVKPTAAGAARLQLVYSRD